MPRGDGTVNLTAPPAADGYAPTQPAWTPNQSDYGAALKFSLGLESRAQTPQSGGPAKRSLRRGPPSIPMIDCSEIERLEIEARVSYQKHVILALPI